MRKLLAIYFLLTTILLSSCNLYHNPNNIISLGSSKLLLKQGLFDQKNNNVLVVIPNNFVISNSLESLNAGNNAAPFTNPNNKNLYISNNPDSCDLMIMYLGANIKARVLNISPGEIKYKRCDDTTGKILTIKKARVMGIKYSNGTIDNNLNDQPPKRYKPIPNENSQNKNPKQDNTNSKTPIVDSNSNESKKIAPRYNVSYGILWILMLSATILLFFVIGVGIFATLPHLLLSFLAFLTGISFVVFFVCWLLKLVS